MKRVSILCVLGVVSVFIAIAFPQDSSAQAASAAQAAKVAVPRLVRFSGVLKDAAGRSSRGVEDVTFSLYATESGGEALWFETQTVEVDSLGRYVVLLGAMHPDGLPMDLFTSGEARWLGVSVGKLPEQARVLLVSVPYALKAGDSESLGGKPAAAYALQGHVGSSVLAVGGAAKSDAAKGAALASTTESQPSAVVSAGQTHFIGTTTDYVVRVTQNGTGRGLYGLSQSGEAVYGQILGTSGTTYGMRGVTPSTTGAGVFGSNTAATGAAYGVRGNTSSTSGAGVAGFNTATTGSAFGMIGQTSSTTGVALFGRALAATGMTYGLQGVADSTSGTGINAQATAASGTTIGLFAKVNSASGTALIVDNAGGGKVASFRNNGAERSSIDASGNLNATGAVTGTRLISSVATGTAPLTVASTTLVPNLYVSRAALADSATSAASAATATNALSLGGVGAADYARRDVGNSLNGNQGIAAPGAAATALDVQASDLTASNTAIYGRADGPDGSGVIGEANNGSVAIGVWGISSTGYAGQFDGALNVTGTLSKTGGSFKIDHPLDPANKYLLHSFVESPDMMNVYNGNTTLDVNGEATIELPDWFEALNRDFRYQLTALGAPGPNLYVAEEIRGNRFRIAGGSPGLRVSWQVTGVRHDAWANAHRIPVEVQKPAPEKGYYLHPQLFGAPAEQSVSRARRPER